jgi:hypothetical protein
LRRHHLQLLAVAVFAALGGLAVGVAFTGERDEPDQQPEPTAVDVPAPDPEPTVDEEADGPPARAAADDPSDPVCATAEQAVALLTAPDGQLLGGDLASNTLQRFAHASRELADQVDEDSDGALTRTLERLDGARDRLAAEIEEVLDDRPEMAATGEDLAAVSQALADELTGRASDRLDDCDLELPTR